MTRPELENILMQFTFRYRVTECLMFLTVEISNSNHISFIDSVITDLKQLGMIHKVTKLKWYQCWFPVKQWITLLSK